MTPELPRYRCHKEVHAVKISSINRSGLLGHTELVPVEPGYQPIVVSQEYMEKHKPTSGGYFVVYEDGYQSFSPAKAFEDGYTLIA